MTGVQRKVLGIVVALAATAGGIHAASDLWLHVRVDEGDGAKVTVNLPFSMVEKAIPMLPKHEFHHAHIAGEGVDVDLEDMRELWQEVKESPDMTFVTVEDGDEHVRVWKENNWVYVAVRDESGPETVDVKIPESVVDALLSGEEIDVEAAVRALVAHGEGEFVTVRDRDDTVRVWVDSTPEAD